MSSGWLGMKSEVLKKDEEDEHEAGELGSEFCPAPAVGDVGVRGAGSRVRFACLLVKAGHPRLW